MKYLIVILLIIATVLITGCAFRAFPKTGDPNIDLALSNQSLSRETKMNILRAHRGEARVPPKYRSSRSAPVTYRPVIDPDICSECDYEADLYRCQRISADNTRLAENAATGAALGAATGAITGALFNVDVGRVAAFGATAGGLQGVGEGILSSQQMVARCMAGRGYSVLR